MASATSRGGHASTSAGSRARAFAAIPIAVLGSLFWLVWSEGPRSRLKALLFPVEQGPDGPYRPLGYLGDIWLSGLQMLPILVLVGALTVALRWPIRDTMLGEVRKPRLAPDVLAAIVALEIGLFSAAAYVVSFWADDIPGQITLWLLTPNLFELFFAALVVAFVVPFCEEVLFRGFVWKAVRSAGAPENWAIPTVSLVFAASHGIGPGIFVHFLTTLADTWLRARTGTVWTSVLSHSTFNLLVVLGAWSKFEVPRTAQPLLAGAGLLMAIGAFLHLRPRLRGPTD